MTGGEASNVAYSSEGWQSTASSVPALPPPLLWLIHHMVCRTSAGKGQGALRTVGQRALVLTLLLMRIEVPGQALYSPGLCFAARKRR